MTKNFQITSENQMIFNIPSVHISMQKIMLGKQLLLRYNWFKNSQIWLA